MDIYFFHYKNLWEVNICELLTAGVDFPFWGVGIDDLPTSFVSTGGCDGPSSIISSPSPSSVSGSGSGTSSYKTTYG